MVLSQADRNVVNSKFQIAVDAFITAFNDNLNPVADRDKFSKEIKATVFDFDSEKPLFELYWRETATEVPGTASTKVLPAFINYHLTQAFSNGYNQVASGLPGGTYVEMLASIYSNAQVTTEYTRHPEPVYESEIHFVK